MNQQFRKPIYFGIMSAVFLSLLAILAYGDSAEADLTTQIVDSAEVLYKEPQMREGFANVGDVPINLEEGESSTSTMRVWQAGVSHVIVELLVSAEDMKSADTRIVLAFRDENDHAWIIADHPVLSPSKNLEVSNANKSYLVLQLNEEEITSKIANSTIEASLFEEQFAVGRPENEALNINLAASSK